MSGLRSVPVLIRQAALDEAEALSELVFRSKAFWGYPDEFMAACRDELAVTAAQLSADDYHCLVAEDGSTAELVGFYAVVKCADHDYELEALFVEPASIGMGIGKILMEHAKATVVAMGGWTLEIQSDPNAEEFYRAAGARLIGMKESGSIEGRSLPFLRIELEGVERA